MTSLLDRQRERFLADPDDEHAFQALEEELFLAGEWDRVMEVYERRLEAASIADQPREVAAIHCRRGQVYQDRRNDPDRAIECYRQALSADAQYRPALSRLRKLYATRGQWDIALQIAEMEVALPLRPVEHAGLLAEMGSIWLEQLGDRSEALAHFKRSLAADPQQIDALEGSASIFEAAGQIARADARDVDAGCNRGHSDPCFADARPGFHVDLLEQSVAQQIPQRRGFVAFDPPRERGGRQWPVCKLGERRSGRAQERELRQARQASLGWVVERCS